MSTRKRSASLDETQHIEESHPSKVVKTAAASQSNDNQQVTKERREQAAKALYDDTIKMIDRNIQIMDRKVVGELGAEPRDYTTEDYAKLVCRHSKTVKTIASVNNTLAFNLLLSMADASHADLDTSVEICGENESARYFQRLDNSLLQLIKARERPAHLDWHLLEVPVRWSRRRTRSQDAGSDEDPDEWSEPDLDNQYREKCNYEHNRRVARRRRREIVDDWVTVALSDLKEERDYLDPYGITGFFPKSIAKLEMIRREMSTGL
ncbi:hypothetical protein ACHAPO_005990 [Fusarium lateritium]